MKVVQVFPGFTTGGPSYTVPMMCRAMQDAGAEVVMRFCGNCDDNIEDISYKSFNMIEWPVISPLAISPGLYRNLKEECKSADIIQTNSLWQFPNFVTEFARRGSLCKSVIVPRGTLSKYALSISPIKKKIILALGQQTALKKCDMFIATCEEEYNDIRALGYKSPVAIIPNGIDIPSFNRKAIKHKRVVFLSRIHKKKGIDYLIKAWSRIEPLFPDWQLAIVGPTNKYGEEMQELSMRLHLKNVSFVGPLYGDDKFHYLYDSELFVLPTHSENWGIAVPEALICSIPVICTKGAPWKGLIDNRCGDWIELSVDSLFESMKHLMSLSSDERNEMGQRGHNWVKQEFSWNRIGEKTISAFKWLIYKKTEKPSFVILD